LAPIWLLSLTGIPIKMVGFRLSLQSKCKGWQEDLNQAMNHCFPIFTNWSNPKGNADIERVNRSLKKDLVWP